MTEVLKRKEVPHYCPEHVDEFALLKSCPRCVNDVYSLGTSLQYYIGDIYLQLAQLNQGEKASQYSKIALKQLDGKEDIQKLVNAHLNESLWNFYNNGGQVVEPPVSEQKAMEIQPFFNRIINNFIKKLDESLDLASNSIVSLGGLEKEINNSIIDMYSTVSKLFQVDEITIAFNQLICIRKNVQG